MRSSSSSFSYLLLILASLFWAGNFIVARAIHSEIAPLPLALARWVLALLLLMPFTIKAVWEQRKLILQHWKILTLLGTLGVGSFNTLVYFGVKYTTANNAILMNSMIPILIMLIAAVFLKQVIARLAMLGVFLSMVGVFVIVSHGRWQALLDLSLNQGDLFVFFAVCCWALYTVCLRWRPQKLQPSVFLTITVVIGCWMIAVAYVIYCMLNEHWDVIPLTLSSGLTIAYLGIFPSLLAYACWNLAVTQVGANRAGLFIHLMPVFGAILSKLFLQESLYFYQLMGMALILLGILFTTRNS